MPERQQYQFDRDAQGRVARDLLAQKAASSRPGQVYHTMTSLQDRMSRPGYTPARADTDQLKALRRDWNRNQKYTPQGMRVSGATSPLDAQKRFMDTTETFRQATSMIDSDKDEQEEYIAKTFGPNQPFYPTDIHPGLSIDEEPLLVDEEQGLTRDEQIAQVLEDPGIRTDAEFLLTPEKTEEELRQEELLRELEENMVWSDAQEYVEPLPFDEGREDYIAASGMNPDLLRQEKLESIHPEDQRMFEPMKYHQLTMVMTQGRRAE